MLKPKILTFVVGLALLAIPGMAAQGATDKPTMVQKRPVYSGHHITGTVVYWNGDRMDLKTPDGKQQQVAVNNRTERLVEIQKGAEVTVDYRRKIGKFIIAQRVRPLDEGGPQAAPAPETKSMTGEVVSANQAELLLRTGSEDVTFFLSPSTRYLVRPLGQGSRVTVQYREVSGGTKMALSVSAAGEPAPGSPHP